MVTVRRDPRSAVAYAVLSALLLLAFAPSLWTCALAGAAIGVALGRMLYGRALPDFDEAHPGVAPEADHG